MLGLLAEESAETLARAALIFRGGLLSVTYESLRDRVALRLKALRRETSVVPLVPQLSVESIVELIAHLEAGVPILLLHQRLPQVQRAELIERCRRTALPPGASVVLATSGTTGPAKLVVHSAESLVGAAVSSASNLGWLPEGDRWYLSLPLAHVGGLALLVRCLLGRQTVVVAERASSDVGALLGEMEGARVTLASFVPTQLTRILEHPNSATLGHLRAILLGGAPCPSALMRAALERNVPVLRTYGMTEMSSQIATEAVAELSAVSRSLRPGYVGRPLQGVEVRLGEDGRVRVSGPMLCLGYLGESLPRSADGFFLTNDRAELGADGSLVVLGRLDHVVITGGENVSPEQVEAALLDVPGVASCAVTSTPDPLWGQRLVAFVTGALGDNDRPTCEAFLRERLPSFAVPKGWHFVQELPVLPTGKLDRQALQRAAIQLGQPSASKNP